MTKSWDADDYALAAIDWAQEPAGAAMDQAVDRLCFGRHFDLAHYKRGDRYSRDARTAVSLLDRLSAKIADEAYRVFWIEIVCSKDDPPDRWWRCSLVGKGWESVGHGSSLPLAVCRAVLHYDHSG